jgi:hypothetical protein
MDLPILIFGIYKIACKSVKSIKEKHKMKNPKLDTRPAFYPGAARYLT